MLKQDCETNAAKRLLKRLKKDYPRMPICIQADNLYETEPMMKLCRENRFEYLFTHKKGHQKELDESYRTSIREKDNEEVQIRSMEKGKAVFVNHVEKGAGKTETANIFEYSYEKEGENAEKKEVRFCWVTSIELTKKNGIYDIEHLNSRNRNTMKNHYLLTQISDIIMQIYLAWNPLLKEIKQSIKNTSSMLLESFRIQPVTDEDVSYLMRYTTVYLE